MTDPQTPATALPYLSVRTAATELLDAIEARDAANIHGWSVALRAALAAEPPALDDVERLIRVLWNSVVPARHWLDNETTTENFARWIIAEYARVPRYARLAREEAE